MTYNFTKYFLILFCSLSFLLSFSQQKKYINFDKKWQISISQHEKYYKCECYVLDNGAFDGPFTCRIDGTDIIVKKYNFKNNVLDGTIYEYFDNTEPKLEATYDNGQPIKFWKEWNLDGVLVVDKTFDENGKFSSDKKKKKLSDYEKMYFETTPFEEPIYTSECIITKLNKIDCSKDALLAYYTVPPLPPSYFNNPVFSGKKLFVKLKYQLSEKGKVEQVIILETSGDEFLDELAEAHILNMTPFESAREYGNPIKYWMEAILTFKF